MTRTFAWIDCVRAELDDQPLPSADDGMAGVNAVPPGQDGEAPSPWSHPPHDTPRSILLDHIADRTHAYLTSGVRIIPIGPANNPFILFEMRQDEPFDENEPDGAVAERAGFYINFPQETRPIYLAPTLDEVELRHLTGVLLQNLPIWLLNETLDIAKAMYRERLFRLYCRASATNPRGSVEVEVTVT